MTAAGDRRENVRTLDAIVVNARICILVGHNKAAEALLRYALREWGDESRLLRLLAQTLDLRADHAGVLDALERLRSLAGHASDEGSAIDVMEARALFALGRVEEARERFARHKALLRTATVGVADDAEVGTEHVEPRRVA